MPRLPGAVLHSEAAPFELEFGGRLEALEIAYEAHGTLAAKRDNAILICPAFSAHAHVRSHAGDFTPGWWEHMVGPGAAFDTERFFVICASLIGSCYGTTGPLSIEPSRGAPYAGAFPVVTTRDMVAAHLRLVDHFGIETLHAVAGGSLGGMQALELGLRHPGRVRRVISVSGTDYTRPYTAAIRHIGRRAIMLDPRYQNGFYGDEPPVDGLRLARELGTLYYRSREEFNERFKRQPIRPPSRDGLTFDVQSYLDYQGRKVLSTFDVNAYLTLSLAMDLHDCSRGFASREAAFANATAEFLIVGVKEDRLIPVDEQREVYDQLIAARRRAEWWELSSPIGHDAFLVETAAITPEFKRFLEPA